MTWSCIHELGHALYEQGLPGDQYGLPAGEAASYSIHESQSSLWENHVGRSESFWQTFFPLFKQYFPEQLTDITTEHFYKAINKVQPSLIRTESDELTYHFHIMIRYELEKKLLEGNLDTIDIPAYWESNTNYIWALKFLIIGADAFRMFTGAMEVLDIFQPIHWEAFMQLKSTSQQLRAMSQKIKIVKP